MDNPKRGNLTRKERCDTFLKLFQDMAICEVYVKESHGGYELKVSSFDYKKLAAASVVNYISVVQYTHIPIERIGSDDYLTVKIDWYE